MRPKHRNTHSAGRPSGLRLLTAPNYLPAAVLERIVRNGIHQFRSLADYSSGLATDLHRFSLLPVFLSERQKTCGDQLRNYCFRSKKSIRLPRNSAPEDDYDPGQCSPVTRIDRVWSARLIRPRHRARRSLSSSRKPRAGARSPAWTPRFLSGNTQARQNRAAQPRTLS